MGASLPPLPAVTDVLKILTKYLLGEDTDVLNQQFVSFVGSASETNLTNLAAAAGAAWTTHIKPLVSNSLTLESYTITDLTSDVGVEVNYPIGSTGSVGGETLPAATAMVIQSKILRRYRGGHPRLYMPGLLTADTSTAQTWSSAAIAAWEAAWNAYIAEILLDAPGGLSIGTFQNVSYYQGFTNFLEPSGRYRVIPTVRVAPVTDAILSYSINPNVGSQRRRNLQP
jgi:hypothetical protein